MARRRAPGETAVETAPVEYAEWRRAERVHKDFGVARGPARFVAGPPIRFQVGGVGGSRFLGIFPRRLPSLMWSNLGSLLLARYGFSYDLLRALFAPLQRFVERPEPMSSCANLTACSSESGAPLAST